MNSRHLGQVTNSRVAITGQCAFPASLCPKRALATCISSVMRPRRATAPTGMIPGLRMGLVHGALHEAGQVMIGAEIRHETRSVSYSCHHHYSTLLYCCCRAEGAMDRARRPDSKHVGNTDSRAQS